MHIPRPNRANAFTLIELLVVISIIALLIALLLPALSSAKTAANTTVCLSNVQQVMVGISNYQTDREGWFPVYRSGDAWWANTLVSGGYADAPDEQNGYVTGSNSMFRCPEGREEMANPTYMAHDPTHHREEDGRHLGWTYHRQKVSSTSADYPDLSPTQGIAVRTWYMANSNRNDTGGFRAPISFGDPYVKVDDLRNAGAQVVVLEGIWELYKGPDDAANRIAARHPNFPDERNGTTNIGFADGHAAGHSTVWMNHGAEGGTPHSTQQAKGVIFDVLANQ